MWDGGGGTIHAVHMCLGVHMHRTGTDAGAGDLQVSATVSAPSCTILRRLLSRWLLRLSVFEGWMVRAMLAAASASALLFL